MTQDLIKESKNKGFMSRNNLVQVNDDYYYLWMCELQKWLRDVHNLHVYIDTTPSFDSMETHRSKYKSHVKVPFSPFKWTTAHYYLGDTYEESLEKGLFHALTLI